MTQCLEQDSWADWGRSFYQRRPAEIIEAWLQQERRPDALYGAVDCR
jgi:hypothetical protein